SCDNARNARCFSITVWRTPIALWLRFARRTMALSDPPSCFFFSGTPTTDIYTLSLHDALPISPRTEGPPPGRRPRRPAWLPRPRSEEHTSELQSPYDLVCRLLLEKKKS